MNRNGRPFSSVAGTILLAALALAATACPKPPPPSPPPPTPTQVPLTKSAYCDRTDGMPVTVFVEYDGVKKKGVTRNQIAYVCLAKDWVEWVSCDGKVQEPQFPGGSPFDNPYTHVNQTLKSDIPKRVGKFPYTMQLLLPTGVKVPIDPRIEVME
jgi:hypothetical protein